MEFIAQSPLLAALIGVAVLLLAVASFVVKRIQVAGPNEAFIITGRKGKTASDNSGQKVVMGASVFVLPFVQQLHVMDLSSRRLPVGVTGAVTGRGIKVELEGVAIVKVGGTEEAIRAAAQRFLNQQDQIESFTKEVLAGSLRSIVGALTVEEIIRDRAAFASRVAEEAEASLTGQGLVLDTFQIQDVRSEGSYLDDLGRPEAAQAAQVAAIAEAKARQAAESERLQAEQAIADSERALALRKAEILAETDAAQAQAAAAGPLAKAARDQEIISAQETVAEKQAALTDRQLDTQVRKPADAARYRREQEAEAERSATIAGAEAERARRAALAEAVRLEGEADASAIAARGGAEAEAMQQKADAFKSYGEAAVLQLVVEMLPELARAVSEPMSNIDTLTVISTDGAGALAKTVTGNMAQLLQMGKDLTGVDLAALVQARLEGGAPVEAGAVEVAGPPRPAAA